MTKVRPVQLSAFPDVQPDKPIGKILPSVFQGTNADLMAAVAPYYLTGSVCDVTYGEGKWWDRFKPDPFVAHDKFKLDGVDFTALPEDDDTYDTVCFDPPYITQTAVGITTTTKGGSDLRSRFGIDREITPDDLNELFRDGVAEAARVVKVGGYVLVKCMDWATGSSLRLGHLTAIESAMDAGLACHDLIVHHTGSGPGGHNIFDPKRARRHHSYLLVFRKGRA